MQGEWLTPPNPETNILFLHGIRSSGESCWQHKNGSYFPELIKQEIDPSKIGIYVHTYKTQALASTYQLGDVVDDLKERMKLDEVYNAKRLFFCVTA